MRRYHPDPASQVPVSLRLHHDLNAASMLSKAGLETWEIAEQAIDEWLAKNEPGSIHMPSFAGIQWKKLFLPNGTVLRTVFGGKNYHCRVEEDQLRYEGKATSPSGFANLVGGIRRNAWKVLWILFPQTQTWQLADDLRPARPARPIRSRTQTSRPAPLASEAPATTPASPEPASRAWCPCGQLVPVDACHNKEQRPAAVSRRVVHRGQQPEEEAVPLPERPRDAQAAAPATPQLQQLAADARRACRAPDTAAGDDQMASEQAFPQKESQCEHLYGRRALDRAHRHAPERWGRRSAQFM